MLNADKRLRLDEKIKGMLGAEGIAGCSVALTDKDGIIYARGFGVRDIFHPEISPNEHTIYRAASITKVITGILAMRLAEAEKISLDSPVKKYLPWLTLSSEGAAELMTLRHLLSHTSGLPAEYTPDGPRDEAMLVPGLKEGLPGLELQSMPGDGKFLYSNWGIRLLSAAVEAVMGDRYSRLARAYVLEPLGMTESEFTVKDEMRGNISLPHTRLEDGSLASEWDIKENHCRLATGGLCSNITDLCRLARLILRGGIADSGERVISEASLEEMMRPHATMSSGDTYGITMIGHNVSGRTVYGHPGNAAPYTSAMYCDVISGYGAVVLLNTYSKDLRMKICDLILSEMVEQ